MFENELQDLEVLHPDTTIRVVSENSTKLVFCQLDDTQPNDLYLSLTHFGAIATHSLHGFLDYFLKADLDEIVEQRTVRLPTGQKSQMFFLNPFETDRFYEIISEMPSDLVKSDMPKYLDLLAALLFADLHEARDAL